MSKYTCELRETLIETRVCTWDEKTYQEHLDWLKEVCETSAYPVNRQHFREVYDVICAYTWEEVLKYLKGEGDPDEEPKIVHHRTDTDTGEPYSWTESLSEYIKEAMREDACQCDVKDSNYLDEVDYDFYEGEYRNE